MTDNIGKNGNSKKSNTESFCIILVEPEALELGNWLRDVVLESLTPPVHRTVVFNVGEASDDDGRFHTAALRAMEEVTAKEETQGSSNNNNNDKKDINKDKESGVVGVGNDDEIVKVKENKELVFLIIAVFWDGQSEAVKTDFIRLRQFIDEKKNENNNVNTNVDSKNSDENRNKSKFLRPNEIQFVVQALNAKKGSHTLKENRDALVNTLRKKLPNSTSCSNNKNNNNPSQHVDPSDSTAIANAQNKNNNTSTSKTKKSTSPTTTSPTLSALCDAKPGNSSNSGGNKTCDIGVEDLSEEAVVAGIEEGQGECFFVVSARTMDEFQERVKQLKASAQKVGVGCTPVVAEPREIQGSDKTGAIAQEFLLRQSPSSGQIELRIAMCGNVDSGKSTLTAVLTRGCRDDGRGFARAFVFRHKHEAATGRTSSISENHLCFSATGEVVNYSVFTSKRGMSGVPGEGTSTNSNSNSANTTAAVTNTTSTSSASRAQIAQELMSRSSKVLTLYDLAGHERYLKTTVLGMTRNLPDYACIVVSANNGVQRMTKEHLALCVALKLPFFVVVTRIDSTPAHVLESTMSTLHQLLRLPTVRRLPHVVRCEDDVVLAARHLRHLRMAPLFTLSSVTGDGVPALTRFLHLLPLRRDWRTARSAPREMLIDGTFHVPGVGLVVGGVVTQGVFRADDRALLGPDARGMYRPVRIKSVHVRGVPAAEAPAGCDAALSIRREAAHKGDVWRIRPGSILLDIHAGPPEAYWQVDADITVLYHATTIAANYEPVVHATTVRQSARIVYVAQEVLRTGDRSLVRFHFLYRPEFMKVGQQIVFREGRTKGIGTVRNLIAERDESIFAKRQRNGR